MQGKERNKHYGLFNINGFTPELESLAQQEENLLLM